MSIRQCRREGRPEGASRGYNGEESVMTQGTNPEHTRAYNRRAVLQALRASGAMSRTEIARYTSLSLQAVSNIIEALVDERLVLRGERRSTRRGQPPIDFTLNPAGAYSLGFSVDQERISGLLLNLAGTVIAEERIAVNRPSPELAFERIDAMAERFSSGLIHEARARIRGLGLSLPGVIEEDGGRVARMVRLPEWEGVRVADLLVERTGVTAFVANDATASALGELWFGVGKSTPTFFYVLFALGLGSSLILDGAPHRSLWTVSGRMGHIPVEPRGRTCPACGETGCLSLYTSLEALFDALREKGVEIETVAELEDLYRDRDPHLYEWLEQSAFYFVRALVVLENLLDPDAFVFGGELPRPLLDHLLRSICERYDQRKVRLRRHDPSFLPSLFGSRATAVGAATIPIYLMTAARYELVLTR